MAVLIFLVSLPCKGDGQCSLEARYALEAQSLGATALVSTNQSGDPRALSQPVIIALAFGIATAETSIPGAFLDAFTLSVLAPNEPNSTAIYLTVDASGAERRLAAVATTKMTCAGRR